MSRSNYAILNNVYEYCTTYKYPRPEYEHSSTVLVLEYSYVLEYEGLENLFLRVILLILLLLIPLPRS
jgi:hypothetical protein